MFYAPFLKMPLQTERIGSIFLLLCVIYGVCVASSLSCLIHCFWNHGPSQRQHAPSGESYHDTWSPDPCCLFSTSAEVNAYLLNSEDSSRVRLNGLYRSGSDYCRYGVGLCPVMQLCNMLSHCGKQHKVGVAEMVCGVAEMVCGATEWETGIFMILFLAWDGFRYEMLKTSHMYCQIYILNSFTQFFHNSGIPFYFRRIGHRL